MPVITFDGRDYLLVLKPHPRARHIKLRTDASRGAIIVTMPPRARLAEAMAFAKSQKDWILGSFAKAGAVRRLEDGAVLPFRGIDRRIIWQAGQSRTVRLSEDTIAIGGPFELIGPRLLRWLKAQARTTFTDEAAYFCERAGEMPVKTSLSSAEKRWGSCSANRNIRINWRLIMAPDAVRQSVIAHEIAHLRHMNHSAEFYFWLDRIFDGNRKQADAWLKAHGRSLYMVRVD